jgi:hypothetical protein
LEANANTTEGRKVRALHIQRMCTSSSGTKARDLECWNMFNEFSDEKEFDYLRKVGDYELPARIRNVGKQRPKLNNLISQQSRRPFTFSVTASDNDSLSKKRDDILREWLKIIDDRTKERYYNVTLQIQMIDQQMQQLEQSIQMAQQNGADQAQLMQLQQMLPMYRMQFQMLKDKAQRESMFTETELKDKERFFQYDFHDLSEELAQKLSHKLFERLDIHSKSIANFTSQCVTGKQYYYVDFIPGERLPRFESINASKVYYPSVEGVAWVQDGMWVALEENQSIDQVKKLYKKYLGEKELKELEEYCQMRANADIAVTPDHGAIFNDGVYSGTLENDTSKVVKVMRIWWKEERSILSKKSPNPRNGKYFTHFIKPGKKILNSREYAYRNGKYINRDKKEDFFPANETEYINVDKGEFINERFILDRYRSVVLNDRIVLDLGKDPVQPRSVDDYYDVMLPIVGKSYSTITDRPYSLMWSTRDLQKLYKIIHYHRELLLAISGTKGNVIDMSQKPKDMSRKEWEYHKKLGRLYVETTDKFGRKINSSFNQWSSFDDTVTASIQYLDNMLESVDNEISDTMGMPRQRMGVTVPSDQVGTSQQSLQQSLLTTEILYYEHDKVLAKALAQLLNLTTKFCFSEDKLIQIIEPSLAKDIVNIPGGMLTKKDWEIFVRNNSKDEQRMNEIKQFAMRQNDKGQLSFEHFFELWNEDSLKALSKKFEYFNQKSSEIAQAQQAGAKQDAIDVEKAKAEFQRELQMMMLQEKGKIEEAKLQIEAQKLKSEQQRDMMKNYNEKLKLEQDRMFRAAEIESENTMESAYLINQDKHETTNEQLQAMKMQIDMLMNQANLSLQNKNIHVTHAQTMRKLDIEDKKANQKPKEKVRD